MVVLETVLPHVDVPSSVASRDCGVFDNKAVSIEHVASWTPLTLLGHPGSALDLIAAAIHEASGRPGALHVIDCKTVRTDWREDLFGVMPGPLTGNERRIGMLERADHGTVVLHNVNTLPWDAQLGLCGVLDHKCVAPVGSFEEGRNVDFAVMSTTTQPLTPDNTPHLADGLLPGQDGRLHGPFYYRIAGGQVFVPPLSTVPFMVPSLLQHFFSRCLPHMDRKLIELQPDAVSLLCDYGWPGDLRELEAVARSLAYESAGGSIGRDDVLRAIAALHGLAVIPLT